MDPIGLAGGINPFVYVGSNTYRWADRSGLTIDDRDENSGCTEGACNMPAGGGGGGFSILPPNQRPDVAIPTGRVTPGTTSPNQPGQCIPERRGLGNIGGGSTTADVALRNAQVYLGPGYKEIAPGVFRSQDGLRQFRMRPADLKPKYGDPHVHFESIGPNGRNAIENSHIILIDP